MGMDFTLTKKGYSPIEVEQYIDTLKREYGNTIVKQRDRIAQLLEEKKQSDKELESYREKSSQISKAIVGAVAKAEEIERLSRIKYNQEISRLKAFHEKWTRYYDRILDEYPLDDRLAAAGEFNRRMDKILSRATEVDDVAAASSAEQPSSQAQKEFDPMERIDRYFAVEKKTPASAARSATETAPRKEYADRSVSGFSFEEALNPTEDLVSILKDLGMSEDN